MWPVSGSPSRRGWAGSVTSHSSTVAVAAGGGQGVPVRGERHRGHRAGVAGQGVAEPARLGRVGDVPQQHRAVVAGGGQGVPVRGERHHGHRAGVAGERVAEPARLGRVGDVPQQHRLSRWRWPGCARPGRTPPPHTAPVWPVSGSPSRRGRAGSVTSHSSTVLSPLAVARVCPSGRTPPLHRAGVAGQGSPSRRGWAGSVTSHSSTVCRRWRWPGCARPGRTPPRHGAGVRMMMRVVSSAAVAV